MEIIIYRNSFFCLIQGAKFREHGYVAANRWPVLKSIRKEKEMPAKEKEKSQLTQVIADARRHMKERENTYREKALKMFPHVCGRCGREFSGKQLRELTVHHRDHNHDNNPPDGSNWELLCIYCHDNEHSRYLDAEWYDEESPGENKEPSSGINQPFAGLADLLKTPKNK
jgi:5-methylcytosine-specific restriction endonuclease McrA